MPDALNQTLYVTAVGGFTTTNRGSIALRFTHSGEAVEDRCGDDEYPTFVAIVNKSLKVTATVRDWATALSLVLGGTSAGVAGSPSDLSCTLAGKAPATIKFLTMTLQSVEASQNRATPGAVDLTWVHQSASAKAVPVVAGT